MLDRFEARRAALVVLVLVAGSWGLAAGQPVLVPLVTSALIAFALHPVVQGLTTWGVPRPVAAAAVVLVLAGAVSATAYRLAGDAVDLVNRVPEAVQKARRAIRTNNGESGEVLERLQEAASELQVAASEAAGTDDDAPPPGTSRVQVVDPPIDVGRMLLARSVGFVTAIGQVVVGAFLVFFLLMTGDRYRAKLVRLAGPSLSQRKVMLRLLDDVNEQVRSFLLITVATTTIVGLLTWIAFRAIGVEQAGVWGIAAAVLNTIPYLGSVMVVAASAVMVWLQFDSITPALLASGAFGLITTLDGMLIRPWLLSHRAAMNPALLFVALMFFGLLWGIWGMLLAMPIMMVLRVTCRRVRGLETMAVLLAE